MPVNFLTAEYKAGYGQFTEEPNELQLARYFHLDEADQAFVAKRRGDHNRLGVALQLTSVRFLGIFLSDLTQVPVNVKEFVAWQLSIKDTSILIDYGLRGTTKREHTSQIKKQYGYHAFKKPWPKQLTQLLYSRSWISNERPSLMFDFAVAWLIQNKVLLPGSTKLMKIVARIREKATNQLWLKLSSIPSTEQKAKLETLLNVPDGERISHFDNLRKGPVTISGPAFIKAVERYNKLQNFSIQELDFSGIPPVRLKTLARHAGMISMYNVSRMPDEKKIAILVAFAKAFEIIALDEAMDVLDLLITDITSKAKNLGKKNRLRTLKDLDRSALALAEICSLILNDDLQSDELKTTVFNKISREKLSESIGAIYDLTRPSDDKFYDEMVEQYGRIRPILPTLLKNIPFAPAPAGGPTMETIKYLAELKRSNKNVLEAPPLDIVSQPWKRLIFNKDGEVTKQGYTLCFISKLQDTLHRRDIYLKNSDRWGDTRAKLLKGKEWETHRDQICMVIGHSVKAKEGIENLTERIDSTYKKVANNFDNLENIRLDNSGKNPAITITNLDSLEAPPSLIKLNTHITELIPKVDLTELLLEINEHTGFIEAFTHVSEANARADDLDTSICAVLLAEACNIGVEPLVKSNVPTLTRHRLNWVKQSYIRTETLIQANARLVDHQATLSLANKWGGGDVASADGLRFVTPVKTINSGPNKKYFRSGRGITWYNFVSDQYSGFHGIVIPGTLRDSIFILEGLLEQQTGLSPKEIMSDTAGSSDMIFGLFWLLGYQFSPRLADAGESKFWRIDKNADYGVLNDLARGHINTNRIEQHYDDMLRVAGSLKMGTVQASELIRSLLKSDKPSNLAKAIIDAGRINKTLYLLNYINDEDYRRRILTQLNRGEGRHKVARAICHGQRGEIRKRYREGQEDQLGTLGLVTNAVVLWNTIYMEAAIEHLKNQSFEVNDEDLIRLSPLITSHINMLGHYSFTLSKSVKNGTLRPLNQNTDLYNFS